MTRQAAARFIVLTGLSGAGKSHAIRALEDLGFFCVDNLPTSLIPTLADLAIREGVSQVAIVADVREKNFLATFPKVFRKLRSVSGLDPALIFLEASNEALVRRFSETRRPHPMAPGRSAAEGIRDERAQLSAIRGMADRIIDTSNLTVHELRQAFRSLSGDAGRKRTSLVVTLVSFGYKHGIPVDADLVFDVRFLPNPHFVQRLRARTGRDRSVATYMNSHPATHDLLARLGDFLKFLIPQYISEGKSYLTIGIGCTGGRHRSVMIAETLKKVLAPIAGTRMRVQHRDIAGERRSADRRRPTTRRKSR